METNNKIFTADIKDVIAIAKKEITDNLGWYKNPETKPSGVYYTILGWQGHITYDAYYILRHCLRNKETLSTTYDNSSNVWNPKHIINYDEIDKGCQDACKRWTRREQYCSRDYWVREDVYLTNRIKNKLGGWIEKASKIKK